MVYRFSGIHMIIYVILKILNEIKIIIKKITIIRIIMQNIEICLDKLTNYIDKKYYKRI